MEKEKRGKVDEKQFLLVEYEKVGLLIILFKNLLYILFEVCFDFLSRFVGIWTKFDGRNFVIFSIYLLKFSLNFES